MKVTASTAGIGGGKRRKLKRQATKANRVHQGPLFAEQSTCQLTQFLGESFKLTGAADQSAKG
jgi:hypothetical protein